MHEDLIWHELLTLLEQLGIEIRWSSGEFRGGLYTAHGIRRILLNQDHTREAQIRILCRELSEIDLSRYYLSPLVRDRIESNLVGAPRLDLTHRMENDESRADS